MAILKIARMGHPVLMGTAQPVEDPKDPRIHGLIADMVETMADAPGIGLAAPQVHVPLRIVVFRVPGERCEDKKDVPLTVLVNPVIEVIGDEGGLPVLAGDDRPGPARSPYPLSRPGPGRQNLRARGQRLSRPRGAA